MTFKEALMAGPEPVRAMFWQGKLGMKGAHRWQVDCADEKRFCGSINLDAAYARTQPDSSRWDYGLGFREKAGNEVAIWIEIHPATAGEVPVVLRKHGWLLNWLRNEAPELAALSRRNSPAKVFFWLATQSGTHIRPGSLQARQLQSVGFDLPRQKITLT